MKRTLLLIFILSNVLTTSFAQNVRLWATYYGGSNLDGAFNITTDAWGNVYVIGQTTSPTGIASPGSHQSVFGGVVDAFLVKFDGAGNRLWATYYGGADADFGYGVKTDAAGNVYITGYTSSTSGISTAGSHQVGFNAATDAFLVKFNANGTRLWGTYFGGVLYEQGTNVATDAAGNVYMGGYSVSTTDIATAGSHQFGYAGGGADAFLAKFDANGTRLWSTYYGGINEDYIHDVTTDTLGNVIVSGSSSSSTGIASPGAFQNTLAGLEDAFVAKFNSAGTLSWATYYGGTGNELGLGIITSISGDIYLSGNTNSSTGISSGGFQNTFSGFMDAFLVKFNAAGNRLWATYYGGTGIDEGMNVAVDNQGNVFLTGDSYTPNIGSTMATPYAFQTNLLGTENFFLVAFNPNGTRLAATYYGASHEEDAKVTVSSSGDVYLTGTTPSASGISSNGFQNTYGGGTQDAVLVKFSPAVPKIEVVVPNDTLPPTPPIVTTTPKKYIAVSYFYKNLINLQNATLRNFSPGLPPPVSGTTNISFTCDFSGIYSDGGPAIPVSCTATVMMKVTFVSSTGATRIFDTEMLQLDLAGGTLPSGVVLRESPTKVSSGQTAFTDIGGGLFRMSSFFDIYSEFSNDAGMSWLPNNQPPARLEIQDDVSATVPTLSQWGLISLGILFLSFGVFYIMKKSA